ncbi:MAG: hypothetical protein FK732_09755 [Asgard group archaeon]|nr:hypothetical protein [Asgard group archaeon]
MKYSPYFIEIEPEEPCSYCGRKKLKDEDKFFKVFLGETNTNIVVCECCKGGFLSRLFEGEEKTYSTHLLAYVKRALVELENYASEEIINELKSAVENYENGKFIESFRCIGFVAEWLTNKLFIKMHGPTKTEHKWEHKLGILLDLSRKRKNTPEEAILHQIYSLKWFRNKSSHPTKYKINGEDVRMGFLSITYLLQKAYTEKLV